MISYSPSRHERDAYSQSSTCAGTAGWLQLRAYNSHTVSKRTLRSKVRAELRSPTNACRQSAAASCPPIAGAVRLLTSARNQAHSP